MEDTMPNCKMLSNSFVQFVNDSHIMILESFINEGSAD